MGSIVRCDAFAKDSAGLLELVQKNRLKFLAVSSNPKDRAILGELSWRSSKQIRFQKVAPATFEKFKSNIRATSDCDGFIFWGHGDFDPQTFVGKLVFLRPLSFKNLSRYESDPRDAFDIALAFEEKNSLRLGYILACESAFWGEGKVNFGYSIVGSLLDRTSLGFVVGAQTNLDVNAAELCIEASMSAIRADPPFPLDLAITEGRRGIRGIPSKDGQKYSALDWWVPVAYAKPSFLDEIEKAELPSDPADVRVPTPGITATASPSGGLAAAHSIGSFGAFANIATNSVRNLFS